MELNNAIKNRWLPAKTVNQKLIENAQTQDADAMQAIPVIFDTVRRCIFKIIRYMEGIIMYNDPCTMTTYKIFHRSDSVNNKQLFSQSTGNSTNLCVNISDLVALVKVIFGYVLKDFPLFKAIQVLKFMKKAF